MKIHNKQRAAGVVAAAGISALILSACGAAEATGAPAAEDTTSPAAQVDDTGSESQCSIDNPCEISFRWWGGDGRQAMTLEALDVFHEQNPDIVVTPMPVSFQGYYQALGVEMAGRNAPDVINLNDAWPLEFGDRGGLLDMNTLTQWLDLTPYTDTHLAASTGSGGELWAIPTGGNAKGIGVNLDIFEELGLEVPDDETWTWDDLLELGAKITEMTDGEIHGYAGLVGDPIIRAFANQTDGGMFTMDGEINFSEDSLVRWFELGLRAQETGAIPPIQIQVERAATDMPSLFADNLAAMMSTWSNVLPSQIEMSGSRMTVLRAPSDFEGDTIGTWLNPSMFWGIAANTQYPEAAARLVDFLVNQEAATEIMGVDRGVPFNPAMLDIARAAATEAERIAIEYVERIAEASGPTVPQPLGSGEVLNINQRLAEEVQFGSITPQQAADRWRVEVQTALDEAH